MPAAFTGWTFSPYGALQATIRGKVCLFSYASKEDIQHKAEGPNHILLTVILNQTLPVTIEVIHEVFSRFGKVDKIVMFQKPGART
jgi:polypyrimidine tract-binding protein 2